jgi:glutamyl-tRNA synthetase
MTTDNKIRTRFAPSPTGYPHIGSMWQALMQWLVARHAGGVTLLRIEDTDRSRFVADAEQKMQEALDWLGLDFDEGPSQGGIYGPYRQSERLDIYQQYAAELRGKDLAYFCFCTPQRLEDLRTKQLADKTPTGYDGRCRELRADDIEKNLQQGLGYVIRAKFPRTGETEFVDLIRGAIVFQNETLDDVVLMKSDGWPTYHLANVVDDHLMAITHVVRGEEWISSAPKHILLYQMFNWEPPRYAHLPLILGSDRSKLSKRHGDVSFASFMEGGYLPQAILNYLALLGWNPKTTQEIFSKGELIETFSLENMNRAGAIFDPTKLRWFNAHYIRDLDLVELRKLTIPYLLRSQVLAVSDDGYVSASGQIIADSLLESCLGAVRERAHLLTDFAELIHYLISAPELDKTTLPWKETSLADTAKSLLSLRKYLDGLDKAQFTAANLESSVKSYIADNGLLNGPILWPWRVAMSGRRESLGPFEIAAILGKDETLKRLDDAVRLCAV